MWGALGGIGGTRGARDIRVSALQSSSQALPNPRPYVAPQLCQPSIHGPRLAQTPVSACPCLQTCHTCVQKHAPLLPNTCSGMALLQHRDPVTSETQECMSVHVRKLPLGTLAGGQLWTQPLQPVLLLTHAHAHTATAWHTAMRPLFLPYNHHRGGSGCHLLFGCPG